METKNKKFTWINFLHIYQPVNTDAHIIEEATNESYKRIIKALEKNPKIKFTININGCIFYRWEELGYKELIKRIGKLIKKGQIDLTGTVCYHPLAPLIPKKELIRQVEENEEILRKHFGKDFKPKGFFLPELAYSPEVAKIIKKQGYKWLVMDELAYSGKVGEVDYTKVYYDKNSGMDVVIREREASNSYVPETVTKILDKNRKEESPREMLITATDAELYGLRHNDPTGVFEKLLKQEALETMTFSEYLALKKNEKQGINPRAHTWATSERELAMGEPFNLWQEKTNIVQKKLWQFFNLVYETLEDNKGDENYNWARWHMVRGLASCTFWWASAKDFRLFGPISWSPDEIERGTNEFIRAVRALESEETRKVKLKAEKMYVDIKRMIWEQHWTYYWKKNAGKKII